MIFNGLTVNNLVVVFERLPALIPSTVFVHHHSCALPEEKGNTSCSASTAVLASLKILLLFGSLI
jgi:hypothetical protein